MFYFLIALEVLPIASFFVSIKLTNIYIATGILMFLTIICLSTKYFFTKKASYFLIFSSTLLIIMGTLTIIFKNPNFIKMKPTIMYSAYGAALYLGALKGKIFIKHIFVGFIMPEQDWKILSQRLAYFCLFLALLNEIIWRSFSQNVWVNFKVLITPLILIAAFFSVKTFIDKRKVQSLN
jgi:intracellular septation protein